MGNTIQQLNGKGIIMRMVLEGLDDGIAFEDYLLQNHDTWGG